MKQQFLKGPVIEDETEEQLREFALWAIAEQSSVCRKYVVEFLRRRGRQEDAENFLTQCENFDQEQNSLVTTSLPSFSSTQRDDL